MPEQALTPFMLDKLSAAWSDDVFHEDASQVMSKSLLKDLSASEDLQNRTWTFDEPLVHRNAAILSYLAGTLSIEAGREPGGQGVPPKQALRLARLWESLAKLGEKTPRGYALLNAACAYELAGYQANAACLAKRFEADPQAGTLGLSGIASTFLQRKFVRLRRECDSLAAEPDYEKVGDMPQALGLAAASMSLSALGAFFLTGDRAKVDAAAAGLAKAEDLFSAYGLDHESALAHTLRALAMPMVSRSTWSVLGSLAETQFEWRRYLMLLARGIGSFPEDARSISEVWPSQRSAVEKGLLESNASKIIRMPTSSGKTRIAEMCILQALAPSGAGAKCVYIAPYRALVAEVVDSLSKVFPDLGFTVSGQDGAYDDDLLEGSGPDADILVVTPEKLDLLLRVRPEQLGSAALFVLDEGHVVGDAARGITTELLMARLRRRFARARFVFLSSMVSDGTMRDLAAWLCGGGDGGGGSDATITTEWRPTVQRHARFEWSGRDGVQCMLTYEGEDGDAAPKIQVRNVIRRETYEHRNAKTGQIVSPTFPSHEKSETAAELALRYSGLGPVLVYAVTKRSAMAVAKRLLHRVEMAAATEGKGVPEEFSLRTGPESGRSIRIARDWLGPDHDVTRLLERGIAVHHAGLPDKLRLSIEADLRNRSIAVTVATDTLSQGISVPIRTVIIHSCRRYDEATRKSERVPAAEYWNLGSSAGRAGHETEGTVIHIVNTPQDGSDYAHYRKKRGALNGIESRLYTMLGDLVESRISPEEVDRAIDSEVLGMLAEEGIEGSCEDMVGEVVSGTLAAARSNGEPGLDRMCERFQAVARSALGLGDERARLYGRTGLGRQGCEAMRLHVCDNLEDTRRALTSESDDDVARLVLAVLDVIEGVPEMSGRSALDGDKERLVKAWIEGKNASEAFEAAGIGEREATRFIEETLGHYAPWGITAFTRIAAAELDLDTLKLPLKIRCLAGMVRYGVPRPEAAWAMRLGVATKEAAVRMAADCGGCGTFEEFAGWLGRLGHEDAIERYGQDSNAASAAVAASRMRANPIVREGRSLDEVIGDGVDVVCTGRGAGMVAAACAAEGDDLAIERDYGAYDRNAIAVRAGGSKIGYVERDVAQYLAPEIDCGAQIGASVDRITRGPDGAVSIKMRLREVDGKAGRTQPAIERRGEAGLAL